jgi:hypothetical protein
VGDGPHLDLASGGAPARGVGGGACGWFGASGGAIGAGEPGGGSAGSAAGEPGGGSLPWPLPSFVGRAAELAALGELLTRNRLVCLTGPGGVGKTRLALEAIRGIELGLPVTFVALEPIRGAAFLSAAVAAALRVRDRPDVPTNEAIAEALVGTAQVLVLDGAEQLRDEVADLVRGLLSAAPGLRIVVTSRRVLVSRERPRSLSPRSPSPLSGRRRPNSTAPMQPSTDRHHSMQPGRPVRQPSGGPGLRGITRQPWSSTGKAGTRTTS